MRASLIGTDAEADRAEISSEELKGFRARWKKRGSDAMSPEASDEGSGELGLQGYSHVFMNLKFTQVSMRLLHVKVLLLFCL